MMDAKAIRGWLLCQPRPVALHLKCGDDTVHELECSGSWANIAASIEAMEPLLIEALDAKGKLIRAVRPDEQEPEAPGAASKTDPVAAAAVASVDAETRRFELMARLIAEAYKHSTDVAFTKLVDLATASNARSAMLEKNLESMHKLMNRALAKQVDEAEEPDALQGMISSFVAGAMQGGAGGAAPTNGKA